MDEIAELQRMLAEVQEDKPRKVLSERSAMDVLEYLKQKTGAGILCTLDGLTFLTLDCLDEQIRDALLVHKRLQLSELENLLNVAAGAIEARFETLKRKFQLIILHGQLIAPDYVESILSELRHELSARKCCALPEFGLTHDLDLPVLSFFISNVESSDAEYLRALRVIGNVIYAPAFFVTLKHKLTGALSGLTAPTTTKKLAELVGEEPALVADALAAFPVQQEGENILPMRYVQERGLVAWEALQRQGCLTFAELQSVYSFSRPSEFLAEGRGKMVVRVLHDCVMVEAEFDNLVMLFAPILRARGVLDVRDSVPFTLSERDSAYIASMIGDSLRERNLVCEIEGSFLWSPAFLKTCTDCLAKRKGGAIRETAAAALIEGKCLEYLAEEDLKLFVVDKALEALSSLDLALRPRRSAKTSAPSVRKLTTDQLIERVDFLAEHFLLCLKYAKIGGDESVQLAALVNARLGETVAQNIVLLLARKFKVGVNPAGFASSPPEADIPELFLPPFRDPSVALAAVKLLPKDVRETILQHRLDDPGTSDEEPGFKLDLETLLLTKADAIALGNFDTIATKKREKLFAQKFDKTLSGFAAEESGPSPDLFFRLALLRHYIKSGFVWLLGNTFEEQIEHHRRLSSALPKMLRTADARISELIARFEASAASPQDLEELMEETRKSVFA